PTIDENQPTGAVFSAGGIYRPLLWRYWGPGKALLHVCGLNPSTADHRENDPTIRREIDFAKQFGYDGLIKSNAFDFRATDPAVMKAADTPLSGDADWWLYQATCRAAGPSVAAWGVHGNHRGRADELRVHYEWRCFGVTKEGFPKHPLYLRKSTKLVPYPR